MQRKVMEQQRTALRRRLTLKDELLLASLPTVIVLCVLWLVQSIGGKEVLFASLASSAFLIYLDPEHVANRVRTLILAQTSAACIGFFCSVFIGNELGAAAAAMVFTIFVMILLNAVHPPAAGTSLIFVFRAEAESSLFLFIVAVLFTVLLIGIERFTLWMILRIQSKS